MTSSAHASAGTTTASGPKSSIVLVHGAWADSSSSVTDRLPGRVTVRHPDMCGGGRDCAGRIEAEVAPASVRIQAPFRASNSVTDLPD